MEFSKPSSRAAITQATSDLEQSLCLRTQGAAMSALCLRSHTQEVDFNNLALGGSFNWTAAATLP